MNIYSLLEEYSLELNDVRWYLSNNIAFSIIDEYKSDPESLLKKINSGELEAELYNLEDRYLSDTQDLIDRGKIDEVNIRETLNEMLLLKRKRKP